MRKIIIAIVCLFSIFSFSQNKSQSIGFIENKGQIIDQKGRENKAVKYLLNTPGLNVQLRKNGFSYDVYETKKQPLTENQKAKQASFSTLDKNNKNTPDYSLEYIYHRIDIDFVNSNSKVKLLSEEKSADYDNYYNVPNKPEGVLMVHKFKQITYKNIYPNIDVVFFIPKDTLKPVEYNFIVHPKGKISDIQLKFSGVKTELVDNKIKMNVRFGAMEETLPMSWIEEGTAKKEIAVGYKKIKYNVYGFASDSEISEKTVIIDPVPIRLWGSYFHKYIGAEDIIKIKTDQNNNVFFIGQLSINYNIATSGVFQSAANYDTDNSFLTKFDQNGNRIWTTYISSNTTPAFVKDFVINSSYELYVVGSTYSGQEVGQDEILSTPGCHKKKCSFFYRDGFILKFNNNGLRIWGTYFGGDKSEYINSIALDSAENLILGGVTNSKDQISTTSSFQESYPHSSDFYESGFFCKFSPDGQQLYGSYFNGKIDYCNVDKNDNIYFSGQYFEDDEYPNISTVNAHQNICNNSDIFLIKFNTDYTKQWCTYYGGNSLDKCSSLEIDNNNNIYLTGTTSSLNNIATAGSFKEILPTGITNGFMAKFNSNGTRLWGTYYGSNNLYSTSDTCESGSVNKSNGDIYLIGNTRHNSYYGTSNSFQPINNGSDECYISKFDTSGNLIWSTFYGTPSQDYAGNIYYSNKSIYAGGYSTGVATNGNNLGTPGTYMPDGGGYLYFIAKFQDCQTVVDAKSNSPICINSDLNLTATGGTNYNWTGPNGFISTQQNPTIANANAINAGQYSCTITGTGDCDNTITVDVVVGDILKPIPDVINLPTITGDCKTIISTIPTATDNCAGIINATTVNPLTYSLPGTFTINWKYNDGNGNIETQTQSIVITAIELPTTTSLQNFCIQQNANINNLNISGQNIKWYDAPTAGNLIPNTTILQNGTTYYASQTINDCESLRIPVLVNIQNTPNPTGNASQSFCATQNATLNEIQTIGTDLKWYSTKNSTTPLATSNLLVDGTKYFATQTINGCESVERFEVTIALISTLNANNYSEMLCDELNDGSENINLSDYNSKLIASTADVIFSYYSSALGAENQNPSDKINSNYKLTLGLHTIYFRIDSNNGCHQIVTLDLELVAKPIISVNDVVPICEGKPITVSAGIGADSYIWSTGATSQTIVISVEGDYSVTATKNYGAVSCSSTKNFSVKNSQTATIKNIEIKDWTTNDNQIIVYTNETGDFEYSIDGINFQQSNQFFNLTKGDYTVTVRDKYGCGSAIEEVYLLMYPKFFTPNGDGYNDTWSIQNSEKENLVVKIFDRYGKLIVILQPNQSWDGTLNGKKLPSTDYWFTVIRENGKEYKGHFSLKR